MLPAAALAAAIEASDPHDAFMQALPEQGNAEQALTGGLRATLAHHAPATSGEQETVTDGEFARTALQLIHTDPESQSKLDRLIDESEQETFGIVETIGVATAALLVLQTHVRFEKDKDGKTTMVIEKRPTDNELMTLLIRKLLAWVPSVSSDS